MAMETEIAFRPLNVFAHPSADPWRRNRRWLEEPANVDLLEGQIAPGFRSSHRYDLKYFGGKTIQNLTVCCFYVGAAGGWQAADRAAIDAALSAAMTDARLNGVMQQYFNAPITSNVLPSRPLASALTTFQQTDVEAMVQAAYGDGTLSGDFGSSVFCFLLAPSIRLLDSGGADSFNGLGGYHGSVACTRPAGGSDTAYYAVGVYSEQLANGTTNGIPFFDQSWKNVVATFYHELNEARTDADVAQATGANVRGILGWYSLHYGEVGDIPIEEAKSDLGKVLVEVPLANGAGTVPVQLMYSNRDHGPAAA